MKYYILFEDKKFELCKPIDGISKGIFDNEEKIFNLSTLTNIIAIDDDNKERVISSQQWLLEIDCLDTSNEWEINSIYLKHFLSFGTLFSQLVFIMLGFPFNIWTIPLFIIGVFGSVWAIKTNHSKIEKIMFFIHIGCFVFSLYLGLL